ncbi:MAG: sporulation protein YqfD [Firmicutes bacterium]|nr:sporulation protein YqfD [Bacillota bacterium]
MHQGYVIIKIKGTGIEEFLNGVSRQGIYLWNVERLSRELLVARINVTDFRKLRGIVRSAPVTVEIRHKAGLPFLWQRAKHRYTLLIGALLSILSIYLLSSIVWFIQINGVNELDGALVLQVLKTAGVQPGTWRTSIEPMALEHRLMLELPQLAWVGVKLKGTLLQIEIVERVEAPKDQLAPGDIIAKRAALITQVIPFVGNVLVTEGETVSQGQVLIDGGLTEYGLPGDGSTKHLRAAGVIKGRVWYTGFGEASLVHYVKQRTQRMRSGHYLILGARRWGWGATESPFPHYAEEVKTRQLRVPRLGLRIPMQLVSVTYHELTLERMEIDLETAKEDAWRHAWEDIEGRLGPQSELVSQAVDVICEDRNGDPLVRIRLVVEVHEEIGVFRPLPAREAEGIRGGSQ